MYLQFFFLLLTADLWLNAATAYLFRTLAVIGARQGRQGGNQEYGGLYRPSCR